MIGSNWPPPLHAHSGFAAPNVAPPSELIESEIHGVGQFPGQGFEVPYRVVSTYTYGECGSAAMAGSQSSATGSIGVSPTQPRVAGAAAPVRYARRPDCPTVPARGAAAHASTRSW